jgi:hypothetical protein
MHIMARAQAPLSLYVGNKLHLCAHTCMYAVIHSNHVAMPIAPDVWGLLPQMMICSRDYAVRRLLGDVCI